MTADLEHTVEHWAQKIRPHLAQAVEGIVAAGSELIAAKEALPHGAFGPLLDELGLSRQMANRFMRVASNPVLAKCSPVGGLPAAVSVLDTLTQLPDDELKAAIEAGDITASTTRQQAATLVKQKAHEANVAARMESREALRVGEVPDDLGPLGEPCGCCDSTEPNEHAAAVARRTTCQRCGAWAAHTYGEGVHLCSMCVAAVVTEWAGEPAPTCCGWPVHPALAAIPAMTETERAGLVESVRKRGLLVPVTTWRGYLLDGRERLMACEAVGVEPTFIEWEGRDPAALIWSLNYCRKDYEPAELAALNDELERLETQQARP